MAKKGSKSKAKRSNQKYLNAFEIAERQANGSESENEHNFSDDDRVQNGIMDASRFLNNRKGGDDFEDEEIDSDEALGSDDDYDILDSKFSQTIRDKEAKRKQRQKNGEVVESSDDEG